MFKIITHEGNANYSQELPTHAVRMAKISKTHTTGLSVGQDVKQPELSLLVGMQCFQPLWKSCLAIHQPHDPALLVLGIY